MKIYIINPDYGVRREDMDRRCEMLQKHVGPDVTLAMDCLVETKVEIDSEWEAALAAPEILRMAEAAEKHGYDAVVLYCFSDPAAAACRERLTIPVIGGAQAAMMTVPLVGKRAAVLLADPHRIGEKELFLPTLGIDRTRIAAIDAIDFGGRDLWTERKAVLQALTEKGREIIRYSHADVLVLGCLSMLGLGIPLADQLGVPVIDPAIAAVTMAESVVRQTMR